MALFKRRDQTALTASSAQVTTQKSSWRGWRLGDDEWQLESWRLYDIVGELRFLSNWVGGAVSRCRLYVAHVDDNGEPGAEASHDPVASLARVPLGSGNRRDENLRMLGVNLYVPGESYIVGEATPHDAVDHWFVVSGREVRTSAGQVTVPRPLTDGGGRMTLNHARGDRLIRVWTPHPANVDTPDSPTRSAIPILREIELLTKREFAELDSRLTGAGVWLLPEGLDFPGGDDEKDALDDLHERLQQAASASIRDQSDASALTPILGTIPDHLIEHVDKMQPINFWSELSQNIQTMKDGAIHRLALAYDIPPEILTGVGGSNRWNAWLSDEQVVKIHIQPLLSRIADALTRDWLHPALEAMGIDVNQFMFAFDTAALTVRPNRLADAQNLWDRGLLSDEATVTAGAFDAQVMPSQQERNRRLVENVVQREPGFLANPRVTEILQLPPLGVDEQHAGRPRDADTPQPDEPRALPDSERDRPGPADTDTTTDQSTASLVDAVVTASTMVVLRALELAGGRLTSPGDRRHRWPDTARHELHTKLSRIPRADAERALAGAWDHVPVLADSFELDDAALTRVLHGYCVELVTRNLAHSDDLLRAAIHTAMANRRN